MTSSSVSSNENSFTKTIESEANSSYDIEQASIENEYKNSDVNYCNTTEMKLNLYSNILLDKYYQKIKNSCVSRSFSRNEQFKYNYRPELLSTEVYGTTSLWYIIMKCNDCEDLMDFKDLGIVLLPDISVITECINSEEFIKAKKIV